MRLRLLFLLLLSGALLYAQENPSRVYLKNGSIINGYLQEESHCIRLRTVTGNVWVFDKTEIDSIEAVNRPGRFLELKNKGYYNFSSFGFLAGLPESEQEMIFSLETSHGYRWDPGFYTGVNIGLELFQSALLPLSTDVRYFIDRGHMSPYIRAKAGFSFPLEDPQDQWGRQYRALGGQTYGLGIGLNIMINPENAIFFEATYRLQDTRIISTNEWNNEEIKITERYRRLEFRMGFTFQ